MGYEGTLICSLGVSMIASVLQSYLVGVDKEQDEEDKFSQ